MNSDEMKQAIINKVGFNPFVYVKPKETGWFEDDRAVNPFTVLTPEEIDFAIEELSRIESLALSRS